MEVSVFETVGLPDGCLLSVRAGNTRRQAPVPLAEPLRFPNLPFNAKQFKVDVLKLLGNARLNINATKEVESYTVDIDVGDNIGKVTIGLTVKEEPSLCGKRAAELKQFDRNVRTPVPDIQSASPSPPGTSEDMFKAVQDTRDYAREHNIPNLVQEMLQHVLRERPDAPYSAMAAYLNRLAVERGEPALQPQVQPQPAASGDCEDPQRSQLEAEHLKLQDEKAELIQELAALDSRQGGGDDVQRLQLEAEHLKLQAEKGELLQELSALDAVAAASGAG